MAVFFGRYPSGGICWECIDHLFLHVSVDNFAGGGEVSEKEWSVA